MIGMAAASDMMISGDLGERKRFQPRPLRQKIDRDRFQQRLGRLDVRLRLLCQGLRTPRRRTGPGLAASAARPLL
ncbi:MAG: hypothetical protein ACJAVS_002088 [Paracoccaceae bacterium]|jgi:hypothetical protein